MTRLGDKIKVERLDTGRLARIEEKVVAAHALPDQEPQDRPAWLRFAPLAAATCALILVAGALGYWLRGSGGSTVAGAGPEPAITTGPDESATVAVGDAVVLIAPNTLVSFRTRPDGRIDLDLARGKVDCDVTPRPGRPVFAVHAADVDVAVVGTAFSVEASGAEVQVTVTRGKVSVTRSGKQVYVAAGQKWPGQIQVAAAEPEPDPDSDPDPDPGSDSDSDPDSDPHPDPGAKHGSQKTGDRQQATGNRRQETEGTAGKPGMKLPAGLPALADCTDCLAIATGDDRTYDDATQSQALYTHIHRKLTAGDRASAVRYADFYLRRFPKGRETAAVKQLRRIAGGE